MAKVNPELNKWTIPSDWDEETDGYMCYVMCVPNSRQWRGVFDGHIDTLSYGRKWNRLTGNIRDNQEVARGIFESMCAVKCDDIILQLSIIAEGIINLAEKSETVEQEIDDPASDGEISVGPGEQFPTLSAYEDAKCNAANGIYDTILESVEWLDDNNVDLLAGIFGGVTSGLLLGLLLAGPVGWAVALVGSVLGAMAGYLVRFAVNFSDLEDAIGEVHEEAVLALYEAQDAIGAESAFITAVEGAVTPVTPVETGLLEIMLSFEMVNNLFLPRSDLADYESPDPIDCGTFCQQVYLNFGVELTENVYQSLQDPVELNWAVDVAIWFNGTAGCGDDVALDVEITDLVGWTDDTHNPGFDQSFRYSSNVLGGSAGCTGWDVHCSDSEPVGALSCRRVNIRSDTDFTVTLDVS